MSGRAGVVTLDGTRLGGYVIDNSGTLAEWFSAVLSAAAVIVTFVIALMAHRQAEKASSEATAVAKRQNELAADQAKIERHAYLATRSRELVEHARSALAEARSLALLVSPRVSELLSDESNPEIWNSTHRDEIRATLARLETEMNLLRVYSVSSPTVTESGAEDRPLWALMETAAWVHADAWHAAILRLESATEAPTVDHRDNAQLAEALVEGSACNLNPRLLTALTGEDPKQPTYAAEAGSPWPKVFANREEKVRDRDYSRSGSVARAAAYMLGESIEEFEDALVDLLKSWSRLMVGGSRAE